MSSDENHKQATRRSLPRRIVAGAGWVLLVTCSLVVVSAAVFRLYYDDERLRVLLVERLQAELTAPVELDVLDLSLWGRVELRGGRIGAPEGFTEPVLSFDRVALRWSLWRLLLWTVSVDEVAIEGVRLAAEEIDGQSSLAQLLRRREPAPSPSAASISAPPESAPSPLTQPFLPIRVVLRDLHVRDVAIRVRRPDLNVDASGFGVEGRLSAFARSMDLDVWVGLGPYENPTTPATLNVELPGHGTPLRLTQRLDMRLQSSGLAQSEVRTTWRAELAARKPQDPAVRAQVALDLDAALLAPMALTLHRLAADLGDDTHVVLRAQLTEIDGAREIDLRELTVASRLGELESTLAALVPDARLAGNFSLRATPSRLRLPADGSVAFPTLRIELEAHDVSAAVAETKVEGVQVQASADVEPAGVRVAAAVQAADVVAADARVGPLAVSLRAEVPPLAPTVGTAAPDATLALGVDVARVRQADLDVAGVRLAVDARTPMSLLLRGTSDEPLHAVVALDVGSAEATPWRVGGLRLATTADTYDLRGEHVDVDVQGGARSVMLHSVQPGIELSALRWRAGLARRGEDLDVKTLQFKIADLLDLSGRADIGALLSEAPVLRALRVSLAPLDVARLMALVPPTLRPPADLAGTLALDFDARGLLPYVEMQRWMVPPVVAVDATWNDVMTAHRAYLDGVRAALARGLPFDGQLRVTLKDFEVRHEAAVLHQSDAAFALALGTSGPRLAFDLRVPEMLAQGKVRDLSLRWEAALDPQSITTAGRMSLGSIEHATLAKPVTGVAMDLTGRYDFASDLFTEVLHLEWPEPRAVVEVSGQVERLLHTVHERRWESPRLPGVATTWTVSAKVDAQQPLPLDRVGTTLAGALGFRTELRLRDGTARVAGALDADGFSAGTSTAGIRELSGKVPWTLDFAFGEQARGVVVSRTAPMGDGVLSLVTGTTDVRHRAARPLYYERMRPYRGPPALTAARIYAGPHAIQNLELDARIESGAIVADWIALQVLGGDLTGSIALQVGGDGAVGGDFDFRATNIDASNFAALDLTPGPASQLSASAQLGFLFAPEGRDLTLNLNVTKIGAQTLDRFLQLLDPTGQDKKLQEQREQLWWFRTGLVRLDEVAAWVRYENLNVDLVATTFLRLPGTSIGYMPVPRELLRRYPLGEKLDVYLQPLIDSQLAPLLGWDHAS